MLGKQADTASPPSDPAAWVADLEAMGAEVGAVYVLGGAGAGRYTPAHVGAALAAGKSVSAVAVPGASPPTVAEVLNAAAAYGFPPGTPLFEDVAIGDNNFTNGAWLKAAIGAYPPAFVGGTYCQPGPRRALFPWGLFWEASPQAAPPTSLPAGAIASQYGQETGPSGTVYDVSLIDLSIFPSKPQPEDPPMVTRVGIATGHIGAALGQVLIYEGPFGPFKVPIASPPDVGVFNGLGWPDLSLSVAQVDSIPTAPQLCASLAGSAAA
jgi:hypothetical protein